MSDGGKMLGPKRKTWFFVGDGLTAEILEREGFKGAVRVVAQWQNDQSRLLDRDLGDDRQGRGQKLASGNRFARERKSEHDRLEDQFIDTCGEFINEGANAFEQLVLVAPPRALGVLRKRLNRVVSQKLLTTIDKDFTKLSHQDLWQQLEDQIERW